jgi:1,4-dihydroxy-2-naphthoate octaprenyltransferase
MAVEAPAPLPAAARWHHVLRTCGPPSGEVDPISKWLVVTRACVQPMTLTAGAMAGLLAIHHRDFSIGYFALAAIGIVLAHAANNMINDYFDVDSGLDTATYPRALYAPHPVLTGLVSRERLRAAILAVNAADAAIMIVLAVARGWPVIAFALAGLLISVGYVAPPLRLKRRGLGEFGVLLVWGPLMVGGTYYAATGAYSGRVFAISMLYGLLVMSVLMGKHIDKLPWDAEAGVRTLPVMLGEERSRKVTSGLMIGFYVLIVPLIAIGWLPLWCLAAIGAFPLLRRALRTYQKPKPEAPPPDYPVWPLWFVSWAFVHSRRAGALLVLGLVLGTIFTDAYL